MKADVDRLVALEGQRKTLQVEVEQLNRQANELAKSIGKAKEPAEREALKERGREFREKTGDIQRQLDALAAEQEAIQRTIPNLSHPHAPVGADDQANLEVARGKTPLPKFDFPPLDHVELGEKLDLVDLEAGARVAGHGFYFLKNEAVLLELALLRYALEVLLGEGFTPILHPRPCPKRNSGRDRLHSSRPGNADLQHRAERPQPGGHGRDHPGRPDGRTDDRRRGLAAEALRHQSLFSHRGRRPRPGHPRHVPRPPVHQGGDVRLHAARRKRRDACNAFATWNAGLFDGLGIPYRVVDTATGDLGGPAYRKFDLEAWMPGRGEFGEVTSTSNCTDYQSRRLNIRYKVKGEKGTHLVHTLNGTAVAISRAMMAILENYQQADGSVVIPEVLRGFVGKERIERRAGPRAGA